MAKTAVGDIRDGIVAHLKNDDRSVSWLYEKLKDKFGEDDSISYSHLYYILVRKERDLTEANQKKINEVLGTTF